MQPPSERRGRQVRRVSLTSQQTEGADVHLTFTSSMHTRVEWKKCKFLFCIVIVPESCLLCKIFACKIWWVYLQAVCLLPEPYFFTIMNIMMLSLRQPQAASGTEIKQLLLCYRITVKFDWRICLYLFVLMIICNSKKVSGYVTPTTWLYRQYAYTIWHSPVASELTLNLAMHLLEIQKFQ